MTLFWLSFVDRDKKRGEQFLGVTMIYAENVAAAAAEGRRLGCKPGCQILAHIVPPATIIPSEFIGRLLDRKEIARLDRVLRRLHGGTTVR